jgi:hypothetical protein
MILFVVDRAGLQPFSDGLSAWAPEWRDGIRLIEYSQLMSLGALPFGAVCFMDLLRSSNARRGLAAEAARRLAALGAPILMLQAQNELERPHGEGLDRFFAAPYFPVVLRMCHPLGYLETLPVETEAELRDLAATAIFEGFEDTDLSVHRVLTSNLVRVWRFGRVDVSLSAADLPDELPASGLQLGRLEFVSSPGPPGVWWESDASACFWPLGAEGRRSLIADGIHQALSALDPGSGEDMRLDLGLDHVRDALGLRAS